MNTLPTLNPKLLAKPLVEFHDRLSAPANLHKTVNRLFFDSLLKGSTFLPDELENLNALFDFLLAFQAACGATVIIAEA